MLGIGNDWIRAWNDGVNESVAKLKATQDIREGMARNDYLEGVNPSRIKSDIASNNYSALNSDTSRNILGRANKYFDYESKAVEGLMTSLKEKNVVSNANILRAEGQNQIRPSTTNLSIYSNLYNQKVLQDEMDKTAKKTATPPVVSQPVALPVQPVTQNTENGLNASHKPTLLPDNGGQDISKLVNMLRKGVPIDKKDIYGLDLSSLLKIQKERESINNAKTNQEYKNFMTDEAKNGINIPARLVNTWDRAGELLTDFGKSNINIRNWFRGINDIEDPVEKAIKLRELKEKFK